MDRVAKHARRLEARLENDPAVAGMITAVDRAAREVDHRFRSFQFAHPIAEGFTIPVNFPDVRGV